jgi:quercetin dioxygenase-like cupin family protein
VQVKVVHLAEAPGFDRERFVARPWVDGRRCNVRLIRLAPGQELPAHRHGESELMLFVAEGTAELETPAGPTEFVAGSLAYLVGDEELRVRNRGMVGVTLLAFLAPPFPPASSSRSGP